MEHSHENLALRGTHLIISTKFKSENEMQDTLNTLVLFCSVCVISAVVSLHLFFIISSSRPLTTELRTSIKMITTKNITKKINIQNAFVAMFTCLK